MDKIAKTLKIIGLSSICLWIMGSILLFHENNGKTIIICSAVILIAGSYAQMNKESKISSD